MIKTCVICSKEFDAKKSTICCGAECSHIRRNDRQRQIWWTNRGKQHERDRKRAASRAGGKARYDRNFHASERGKAALVVASHNRRVRFGGNAMTTDIYREVREESLGYCPYCGDKIIKGEIDHIIPIETGGSNARFNLAWICKTCNRAKGTKSIPEFLLYRQNLRLQP